MDAYDGGSGAPRRADTSDGPASSEGPDSSGGPEAVSSPVGGVLPAPRAELRSSTPVVGAGAADEPAQGQGSDPGPDPGPEPASATAPRHLPPRTGVAALSPRYQVGAALALAVVAVTVCVHVGMVFLHVAPSNTVTKAHGKAIDDWIYPEFEQNWKLFAPNPLQQNIAVQVRAQIRGEDGGSRTTGWYDLSAQDGRDIDGNLVPSHTQQNELRRAWDFFTATHDGSARPVGLRGALAETYLRRIVVMRLERGAVDEGGVVERVQIRSRTTNVPPPKWSTDKVSTSPVYRVLSWWSVPDGVTEGGAR
ncbi:DUF5819 family protein [Streptomyces sp. NPDC002491]